MLFFLLLLFFKFISFVDITSNPISRHQQEFIQIFPIAMPLFFIPIITFSSVVGFFFPLPFGFRFLPQPFCAFMLRFSIFIPFPISFDGVSAHASLISATVLLASVPPIFIIFKLIEGIKIGFEAIRTITLTVSNIG